MSKTEKIKSCRPLLVNHNSPVSTILDNQKDYGKLDYSQDVIAKGVSFGMVDRIQTVSQRESSKKREHKFYGIELEIATSLSTSDLYSSTPYPFFLIKSDSSISGVGENKAEIVSLPKTMKAHRLLWAGFLQKIKEYTDQSLRTNNGIHIHCSRKDNFIDSKHERNFIYFMNHPAMMPYIFDISERDRWGEIEGYSRFLFANPRNSSGVSPTRKKADVYKGIIAAARRERGATNLKDQTIEVRVFKGIPSYATLMKNLEFVDSVICFTEERSAVQCNWEKYTEWLDKETHKNQYKLIKKFIKEHIHEDSPVESQLMNVIFRSKIDLKTPLTFKLDTQRTNLEGRLYEFEGVEKIDRDKIVLSKKVIGAKLSDMDDTLMTQYVDYFRTEGAN